MIKGIGIDLVELNRIERALKRNQRFVRRVLTDREQNIFAGLTQENRQVEFLAGRFAAKEAFAKAAGTGIGELSFQHIEILPTQNGAPIINVKGYEQEALFVSISHSEHYAIAQVIIAETI